MFTEKYYNYGNKSFRGARKATKKEFDAPILVTDYMTKKLVTFRPEQSILEVMEQFTKFSISVDRFSTTMVFW